MKRLLVVLLLLTGCGVPTDDRPRALDPADAPFTAPTPAPVGDPTGPGRVALYFVEEGRIVLKTRAVQRSTPVPELLELLLAGPTPEEVADGTTTLTGSLAVESLVVEGTTGVVTLGETQDQASDTQPLAFAQVVTTLTARGRLTGVRFRRGDTDLRVPRGDGELTAEPLDRFDYLELSASAPD